jgi:acyl-CoA synthetase (AMP-forming)/AMP-acid ligase II
MVLVGEPYPEPFLPFRSVKALFDERAASQPDKTALVDLEQGTSLTYAALHAHVNRIARFLADRGIGPGDKVGLLSGDNLEKLVAWLGVWRAGAAVCPLNVELNADYISGMLQMIEPKLVLWHRDLDGPALCEGVDTETIEMAQTDPGPGEAKEEFFTQVAAAPDGPPVDADYGPDDLAAIFCTSGTTSRPKLIVHRHMSYWLSGLSTLDMLGLTPEDKTLEYRSFGWNSAQILSLMPWLQMGHTLHIAPKFSHHRFFEWIQEHGITFAAGVPTVVNMLLNEPTGITADDIPSLRLMTCSTAPLSPAQWRRFEEMYGVRLLQLYGMSEAGWICGNRHDDRKMGTVGRPARYQQFQIVDGEGNPCPAGSEGEVTIGGPQVCYGTISPEGEFEDWTGGRFKTGDLAVMDEDGYVTVTGRTKDLIVRGGVNISPLEIDHVLMRHQGVHEAAAVGVPDDIYGEEVVCYVVPRKDADVTADQLTVYCTDHLPTPKLPKAFYFVDALPKNDRGKIRRDDLKRIWNEQAAATP